MQQLASPDGAAEHVWQSLSIEHDEGHVLAALPEELPEELPDELLLPLLLLLLLPLSSPAVASAPLPPELPPDELPKPVGVDPAVPPHAISTARADRQRGVVTRDPTLMLDSLCLVKATRQRLSASHMPSREAQKRWARAHSALNIAQSEQYGARTFDVELRTSAGTRAASLKRIARGAARRIESPGGVGLLVSELRGTLAISGVARLAHGGRPPHDRLRVAHSITPARFE